MDMAAAYDNLLDIVHRSSGLSDGWHALQELAKEHSGGTLPLPPLDEHAAIIELAGQVEDMIREKNLPQEPRFLYFGLFDSWDESTGSECAGFYLSGGTGADPEEQILEGELDYTPDNQYLQSTLLNDVYDMQSAYPEHRSYIGYVLLLGTAALLVKFAAQYLKIKVPVYIGFDSGDYMMVSPGIA